MACCCCCCPGRPQSDKEHGAAKDYGCCQGCVDLESSLWGRCFIHFLLVSMLFSGILIFYFGCYFNELTNDSSPEGFIVRVMVIMLGLGLLVSVIAIWIFFSQRAERSQDVLERNMAGLQAQENGTVMRGPRPYDAGNARSGTRPYGAGFGQTGDSAQDAAPEWAEGWSSDSSERIWGARANQAG